LKEIPQRKLFNVLLKNNIKNFIGVPDSTMKFFIDQGFKKKKIIITTREEEAIGIATGMVLSKSPTLVFMQNAGFANSISTISSLVALYKIPLIFLLGWRGFLNTDAPEHLKIGQIQPELIKLLDLDSKVVTDQNWKKSANWAVSKIKRNISCVLIIKRIFND